MPNYYFLVGTVSFLAGVYIDQNYNVPNIKYWAKHAEEVVGNFILLLSTDEKKYRKKGTGDDES